ncbi:DUF159 family protein [Polymorphobacter glacialis]|uniref:Abasic site processing protein n=1 Tax=Sandarakinorhabdus glacialis TaxID=1614636 RepID=A0A916ZNK0_9SPHN|nr:SOS response-associated peptidase family protein [Polymorphobacter glacialis]GGE06181.1 DUF159 family protein [Polymorphobacter glacialis]
MCNEVARRIALGLIREDFSELKIVLKFSEGLPNLAASDSIRITDTTAIIRAAADNEADMVQRRWSWPSPSKKPVYNYRSEGREFANSAKGGRCLIPVDGFYEFTTPETPPGDPKPGRPKPARKDKWLFTARAAGAKQDAKPLLCIAGLWRADPQVGEAFTMLTCDPGPDIAPYHSRQIVLMPRERWADWLAGTVPAASLIAPTPAGTLLVTPATPPLDK